MPFAQYQARDIEVVDYELFEYPGFPYMLRGPAPRSLAKSISIIGAGQSMGVLVRRPYATRIREEYGVGALNFSVGGSAPKLYLNNSAIFKAINKTKCCIVQVLSARSSHCSYFETRDGKNMMRLRGSALPYVPGDTAWEAMFRNEPRAIVEHVVAELQRSWVSEMSEILNRITVPTILLWFSKRTPEAKSSLASYRSASGIYPQFVFAPMIEEVRPLADHYVEASGSRGMPNRLTSRHTGELEAGSFRGPLLSVSRDA